MKGSTEIRFLICILSTESGACCRIRRLMNKLVCTRELHSDWCCIKAAVMLVVTARVIAVMEVAIC